MTRTGSVFGAVLALFAFGIPACGGGDGGGSSGCPNKGDEVCAGDVVMQCNDSLQWEKKKDCTETGRKCVQVSNADADCTT